MIFRIPLLRSILILVAAVFLLAACLVNSPFQQFESNGERIYYTGVNENGRRISYSSGSSGGMMMNRRLTCAACHGEDGKGGPHIMHMTTMDAPDIRYSALKGQTGADDHESTGHDDEHGSEYSIETFTEAVVEGRHPDGARLSRDMPRWSMGEQDLADLFEFIKTLP